MYNLLTTDNILFYLFSLIFWPFSFYCLSFNNKKQDIVKNFTHLLHAILFVGLYKLLDHNIISYPIILSIGFYTCDLFYILHSIIIKKERFLRHLPYIIHHFISNYGLYMALNDYCREQIIYFFYMLEYSNFSLYLSYHIQKEYSNYKNLILVSQCFQFVWYTYFRIIRFLIYLFHIQQIFMNVYISVQLITLIIFVMGAYWSWNLLQKCFSLLKIETLLSIDNKLD
jgi:hypothetical protein